MCLYHREDCENIDTQKYVISAREMAQELGALVTLEELPEPISGCSKPPIASTLGDSMTSY